MRCNQCGAENPENSVFCMNCGFNMGASQNVSVNEPVYNADANVNVNQGYSEVNTNAPVNNNGAAENNVAENVPVYGDNAAPDMANYAENNNSYDYANGGYMNNPYQENPAPAKKKKAWLLPVILVAAAIAVIAVVVVVLVSIFGGRYVFAESEIVVEECNGTYLVIENGEVLEKIEAKECYTYGRSLKGDVCAIFADGELYVVSDSKVESIAEDVDRARVSQDGNALLYRDEEGALYHYDIDSGDTTDVAEDVADFEISPDGESYVYAVSDKEEKEDDSSSDISDDGYDYNYDYNYDYSYDSGNTYTVYIYDGSDSIKIGSDYTDVDLYGISDGAQYTYVGLTKDEKEKLYVYLDAADDKMVLQNDGGEIEMFNDDLTQALIDSEKGTYIFDDGEEPVKISSKALRPIGPNGAVAMKDLFDAAYKGDDAVYYVDGDGNAEKLVENVSNVQITKDGDYVYYSKKDTVCKIKVSVGAEPEELVEDVEGFYITPDGDEIYYGNSDEELYCYTGGSKGEKISKFEVDDFGMTADGVIFFRCDDELYYCDDGSSAEKICSGIEDLEVGLYSVMYYVEGDDYMEVYLSDGSDDFEMVYDYEPSSGNSSEEYDEYYDSYY